MGASQRRPQDSMVSTWRDDPSQWRVAHHILNFLDGWQDGAGQEFPVFQKTDPMPYLTQSSCHRWIITHAVWPLLLQAAYYQYTGHNLHPIAMFFLYSYAFKANSIHQVSVLRRIAKITGFLDGDKHARDKVPDVGVNKVLLSVELTTSIRPIFTIFLAYRSSDPVALSWWLPVELFLYSLVLDFWFYVYHRACHEVNGLWQYHRTHHLTKHPNPLLSAYSDAEQEIIEIALVPLLTYACLKLMGFPMGFYDWWICHQYLIFSEAFGHSGLRIWAPTPGVSSFFLRMVDCELVLEDHDLHHRQGWRKSANYGKQTLFWDRLFGTAGERIEAKDANVDFSRKIDMPWY